MFQCVYSVCMMTINKMNSLPIQLDPLYAHSCNTFYIEIFFKGIDIQSLLLLLLVIYMTQFES